MENQDVTRKIVDQFVQTPETEGIIYSTYTSTCLHGFREQALGEIKDDIMKLQIGGNVTKESINSIVQKYLDKFPPEVLQELYSEIITFIQNN